MKICLTNSPHMAMQFAVMKFGGGTNGFEMIKNNSSLKNYRLKAQNSEKYAKISVCVFTERANRA